ncbi:MAG: hypothetical protein ACOCXM_06880 [Myxococcota bacterium]
MTRPTAAAAGLVVLAALTFGCERSAAESTPGGSAPAAAGGESAEEAPPPIPEPLALLPSDAFAVVDVNMNRLRDSPYHDPAVQWLQGQLTPSPERQAVGRRMLAKTERVLVGVLPPGAQGDHPEAVVVAQGDYGPGELEEFMRQAGEPVAEVHTIEGHRVFVEKDVWAAEVPGPTWVFASASWIRGLLERTRPGMHDPSPFERQNLQAMADRIDFGHAMITAVAEVLPRARDELGDDRWFARDTGQALREVGVRADLPGGADLEVVVHTADATSARDFAQRTGELIQWAGGNVFVGMLGLGPVFDATEVRAEQRSAVLDLHLEDADVRRLIARLEAMAGPLLQQQGVELQVDSPP